jgi:adenylate cyclase class IV
MARNVELKARVHDLEPLRTRVMALGAIGPVALMQTDTFFNVPSGRLKLREFGDHTGELIYYVRPDTEGPKISDYLRAPTTDPDALRQLLTQAQV